jgi:hypothetical protein
MRCKAPPPNRTVAAAATQSRKRTRIPKRSAAAQPAATAWSAFSP